MRRFSEEDKNTIWDMREAGVPVKRIAKHLGRQNCSIRTFLAATGASRVDLADAWLDHLYPDHGYGGLHGEGTDELFRDKTESAWHSARLDTVSNLVHSAIEI